MPGLQSVSVSAETRARLSFIAKALKCNRRELSELLFLRAVQAALEGVRGGSFGLPHLEALRDQFPAATCKRYYLNSHRMREPSTPTRDEVRRARADAARILRYPPALITDEVISYWVRWQQAPTFEYSKRPPREKMLP